MVQSQAHALNNVLLAARANLELLQGVLPDAVGQVYLERALANIDRAADLVSGARAPTIAILAGTGLSGPPPERGAAAALAGRSVLVCEDDRSVRELLADLLRTDGASVRTAASVGEAQSALAGQAFDLIVLDRRLAGGDGLSVAVAVAGAKILIVTGERAAGDAPDRPGGFPTLVKPFRIDAFRQAVADVLNG